MYGSEFIFISLLACFFVCFIMNTVLYLIILFIRLREVDVPSFFLPLLVAAELYCLEPDEAFDWVVWTIVAASLLNVVITAFRWKNYARFRRFKSIALIVLPQVFLAGIFISISLAEAFCHF